MYQEDPKTSKGPTSPNNTAEFLFRGPFQPKNTKTYHIPTVVDHEPEHGEHSRDQDQHRNEKHKEPFTDETEEEVEILLEHIKKCHKDKKFQKFMEIFLNKEKEKYYLKFSQEAAKMPHHFNVETIITPEEETKTSKLQRQLKIMQE